MKNKHQNRLFYWILIAGAVAWIMYRYDSTRQQAPELTPVICVLPDGTVLPLGRDSVHLRDIYKRIPAVMRYTAGADSLIKIIVPEAGRYKVMLNEASTVFLNEQTTVYFPIEGDGHHTMGVDGDAYFVLNSPDTGMVYNISAKDLDIECRPGRLLVRSRGDFRSVEMITASGRIKAFDTLLDNMGPMRGVAMARGADPRHWAYSVVDTILVPDWAISELHFDDFPFKDLALFIGRYYHVEVTLENEYLGSQRVNISLSPQKHSLEAACEIIGNATGFDYELNDGKVTFILKPLL